MMTAADEVLSAAKRESAKRARQDAAAEAREVKGTSALMRLGKELLPLHGKPTRLGHLFISMQGRALSVRNDSNSFCGQIVFRDPGYECGYMKFQTIASVRRWLVREIAEELRMEAQ